MSAVKSYFRDSFSVTSIFIVIANFSVTENSSRAEFNNSLFSSQQPLRFAALSTSPYTGEAFTCGIYTSHYQHNSILFCFLGCGFALPTPCTGEAFTCGICTLHYQRNSILFCLFGFGLPTHYTGEANAPTDFICIISVIQYYFAYSATASQCSSLT